MKKIVPALVVSTMLMTTASTFAAESTNNSIDFGHADKTQTQQTDLATGVEAKSQSLTLNTDVKSQAMAAGNKYVTSQIEKAKSNPKAPFWLKNADIGITFGEGFKPEYSFETLFPVGKQTESVTTFTQFRLANNDDESSDYASGLTANFGYGQRFLNKNKTAMTGYNVFYDHAFKHGHARIGAGFEYFQGRNEYRANIYHAISGEKEVDTVNHIFEKALSGYDAEIGTSLPNAPWMKVFLTGYSWGRTYAPDINGYKLRTEIQVTPQLNIEYGYNHDNNGTSGQYGKITYNILANNKVAMFEKGKKVFRSADTVTVENKRFDHVKRENRIRVERYQKTTNASGQMVVVSMNRVN